MTAVRVSFERDGDEVSLEAREVVPSSVRARARHFVLTFSFSSLHALVDAAQTVRYRGKSCQRELTLEASLEGDIPHEP